MPTPDHLLDILSWHAKANKLLILLVGPPCSGKSSFDVLLRPRLPHTTVSTDNPMDPRVLERPAQFNRAYEEALMAGNHIVIDQTNLTPAVRQARLLKAPQYLHIALDFMSVPFVTLCNRNKHRSRHIPNRVIRQLCDEYRPPQFDEGFDYIFKVTQ